LLLWPVLAGAALCAFAAAIWLGAKCVARIGGYTGDCLGAVQQLAEVVIYLAVVAGLQQGAWQ
jgi:adenosylcobinamide-GDP ribazoletransferase